MILAEAVYALTRRFSMTRSAHNSLPLDERRARARARNRNRPFDYDYEHRFAEHEHETTFVIFNELTRQDTSLST